MCFWIGRDQLAFCLPTKENKRSQNKARLESGAGILDIDLYGEKFFTHEKVFYPDPEFSSPKSPNDTRLCEKSMHNVLQNRKI